MAGLMQPPMMPQQQARPAPVMPGQAPAQQPQQQQMAPPPGKQFFQDAAVGLLKTDPELADDIKGRARALDMQMQTMGKLMKIGQAMGEDVSALAPIMQELQSKRQKAFMELIGRANVPTSASKPKFKVPSPEMK